VAADPTSGSAFFATDRGRELIAHLDPARIPSHVAVIMDGNGRWARMHGLPRLAGHRAGAEALRELITAAIELGIGVLTVFSFSSENWTRPREEVQGLMGLFVEVLTRELDNLERLGVRVRLIGRTDSMPAPTLQAFLRAQERTEHLRTLTLVIALDYGGRAEIADAAASIAHDVADGRLSPDAVDEDAVASRLYAAGLPDPDLIIRTSGEMRLSNFLLWQSAYSEIHVTPVLWPDFDRQTLLEAVIDYQSRERRFGGTS